MFNKEITKEIRVWLKDNGFDCGCRLGREFYYEPNDEYIAIPRKYEEDCDSDFLRCLKGLGLENDFDCSTLSVLHELGHHETYYEFSECEWENETLVKEALAYVVCDNERNFAYWNCPTEHSANEWAVWFANTHPNETQALEDIIGFAFI